MDYQTAAAILIALGVIFLVSEVFLPTGGILFGVAVVLELTGVILVFLSGDTRMGIIALAAVFIGIPALSVAAFALWPYTPLARQMARAQAQDGLTLADTPENQELESLRGRVGKALSDLRPAGSAEFDGKRRDVVTEGMHVPAGSWVRCVDVRPSRVVVRQIDTPTAALDDMDSNL